MRLPVDYKKSLKVRIEILCAHDDREQEQLLERLEKCNDNKALLALNKRLCTLEARFQGKKFKGASQRAAERMVRHQGLR